MADTPDAGRVRLDKWLWAARFFKTRTLAAEAIAGGKVDVNGERAKRAKPLQIGDALRIRRPPFETYLVVRALSERRGRSADAELLYEETPASRAAREALATQLRALPDTRLETAGPPRRTGARSTVSGRDRRVSSGSRDPLPRRQRLAGVPLRMLREVEQQTGNRGRKLRAADRARQGEGRLGCHTQDAERTAHRAIDAGEQRAGGFGWISRRLLVPQRRHLLRSETLASGVCEKPADTARGVPQVKADRRDAARSRPQIGSVQPASGARQVSLRLQQRVRGGLQERRD